ncbi:MAG TPA: nicotinate-nucleotide adenylyltransferase [Candidatus Methylacidiphilales bacterium]|nr:nicotinate-nucleotide adenylyltransferase [Candidatus Methylacidiphilales bacterium]
MPDASIAPESVSATSAPTGRARRIGLYGGTFDPVHLAHLITAQDAMVQLRLDEMLFVPAYRSPFKTGKSASDSLHRLEMLRLSLQGVSGFGILETEIRRAEPSYAIDTVLEVRAANSGAELFFLIGEDHLPTLDKWHRAEELHRLIRFAMQTRRDFDPSALHTATDVAAEARSALLSSSHSATSATPATALSLSKNVQATPKNVAQNLADNVIRLPNSRHVDISASEIRRRVQQRLPIHFLVTPAVAHYIASHGLYQE